MLVAASSFVIGAGVAALIAVLFGILRFAAATDRRSEWAARPLEFAAICFGSIATVGALMSLVIEAGSIFLYAALAVTILVASLILWGRRFYRWVRGLLSRRRNSSSDAQKYPR